MTRVNGPENALRVQNKKYRFEPANVRTRKFALGTLKKNIAKSYIAKRRHNYAKVAGLPAERAMRRGQDEQRREERARASRPPVSARPDLQAHHERVRLGVVRLAVRYETLVLDAPGAGRPEHNDGAQPQQESAEDVREGPRRSKLFAEFFVVIRPGRPIRRHGDAERRRVQHVRITRKLPNRFRYAGAAGSVRHLSTNGHQNVSERAVFRSFFENRQPLRVYFRLL